MKTKKKHGKWVILLAVTGGLAAAGGLVYALLHFLSGYLGIYLMPPTPYAYGKTALDKIASYGLYADTSEWKEQYPLLLQAMEGCQSYEETYPVIEQALSIGGGKHSFLEPVAGSGEDGGEAEGEVLLPVVALQDGILQIQLPAFSGDSEQAQQYAATVQDFVQEHQTEIQGVVVDLRDNTGGDLGPMLSALSAFLPEGELLYYHYRQYDLPVSIQAGRLNNAGSGSYILYPENKLEVPVALLTNDRTASSGEAVVLSFAGLERVRSFGTATAGYTSVNMAYQQYDGACMYLTVAGEKTREGEVICEDPIVPDEESEAPLEDALLWLKKTIVDEN